MDQLKAKREMTDEEKAAKHRVNYNPPPPKEQRILDESYVQRVFEDELKKSFVRIHDETKKKIQEIRRNAIKSAAEWCSASEEMIEHMLNPNYVFVPEAKAEPYPYYRSVEYMLEQLKGFANQPLELNVQPTFSISVHRSALKFIREQTANGQLYCGYQFLSRAIEDGGPLILRLVGTNLNVRFEGK